MIFKSFLGSKSLITNFELKESNKGTKRKLKDVEKIEDDRESKDVSDAYFPARQNNRLTLYQDADTPHISQVYLFKMIHKI